MGTAESARRASRVYGISMIDIALWDILGKSVGKPIWQLLGAVNNRVPVYGGGGFLSYTVADLINEAEKGFALGTKYYKMKVGLPNVMENVNRVREVRKAVGEDVMLIVDANQRWDVHTNIRVGKMIEQYNIFWYEEPVYADNIGQCAEVARNIGIPRGDRGKRVHPLRLQGSHRTARRGRPQPRHHALRRHQRNGENCPSGGGLRRENRPPYRTGAVGPSHGRHSQRAAPRVVHRPARGCLA